MKADKEKNEQCTTTKSCYSATIENKQVELFFQFDNEEPISAMKCNGNKFSIEMIPCENKFLTFTDGKKTMKLFVKHC